MLREATEIGYAAASSPLRTDDIPRPQRRHRSHHSCVRRLKGVVRVPRVAATVTATDACRQPVNLGRCTRGGGRCYKLRKRKSRGYGPLVAPFCKALSTSRPSE